MATHTWIVCLIWISAAILTSCVGAHRALGAGRGLITSARLASPTVYLFAAYLAIAGLVTPTSPGESSSPMLWLALVLPVGYALASLAAIGPTSRSPWTRVLLGLLHGGAVLAAAAIVLGLASPAFVPTWLR